MVTLTEQANQNPLSIELVESELCKFKRRPKTSKKGAQFNLFSKKSSSNIPSPRQEMNSKNRIAVERTESKENDRSTEI